MENDVSQEMVDDIPACAPIADAGGIGLLPFPRIYVPRGSPFRLQPNNYLYLSSRANQNVRKKFHVFTERLSAAGIKFTVSSSTILAPLQALISDSPQFPKWVKMEPQLRGDIARVGGYKVTINQDCLMVQGADETGLQNGCCTLLQLIEDGPDITGMEIDDYPVMPYRAIHIDCKGWPPTIQWLRRTVETLAAIKINVLILEYDGHFNYATSPELASEGAFTSQEISDLDNFAKDCGITLVPMLSCVGNGSQVLANPQYASLREHPDYPHMFCVADTNVQDFLCSRLSELLPLHTGKIVHIGGDGAFLLGSNPATQQRAEALGGLDGVYLEHLGVFCRYLVSQGAQPIVSDEMLRHMTDAQIKWLPPETAISFWLPTGLTPDIAQEVLAHLERYKVMQRVVWASTVISPTKNYEAFDSLDAWGEVGDMGYVTGMIATVRTRDCANMGLLPPLETAWPSIFYAAERAWSGKEVIARELFPQRFVIRFFGVRNNLELQSRLWAGIDSCITGQFAAACTCFTPSATPVLRNEDVLRYLESWSAANAFMNIHEALEGELRGNFSNIQNGTADALFTGRLRWQVQALKARAPEIIANLTQHALPFAGVMSVHEYVESALAYTLRRLDELEPLLEAFPLPPEDMRGGIGI